MIEFARRIDEFVEIDDPTKSEMAEYCKSRGLHDLKNINLIVKQNKTWSDLVSAIDTFLKANKE